MGKLLDRNLQILARSTDLSPVAGKVRDLVRADNREAILSGQDCHGHPVAALAASTLERRDGHGPARAPRGAASRMVAGLVVAVFAGVGKLTLTKSWPGEEWVKYHISGTRRMPRRDPSGVRPEALERARKLIADHIMGRGTGGR